MDEKKTEEIENIFGESILPEQNQPEVHNPIEDVMDVIPEEQNIENVVEDYFSQSIKQPISNQVIEPVIEPENIEPIEIIESIVEPVTPLSEQKQDTIVEPIHTNTVEDAVKNFKLEDANRATNEHPDAKVTLNNEPEIVSNETATVEDLKAELKSNPSLKFILILGIVFLLIILVLPYISNFLK